MLNANSRGEVQTNVAVNTCKIRESDLKRMVHDIRKRMKIKDNLKILAGILFKTCDLSYIRNLVKTTELAETIGVI